MDACPGLFDDISSELEDINLNVENVDSSHNEKVLLRSIISDDAKEASIVHELLMDKARGLQGNKQWYYIYIQICATHLNCSCYSLSNYVQPKLTFFLRIYITVTILAIAN